MTLMKDDKYLITGSIDSQLTVWKISQKNEDTNIENGIQHLSLEPDNPDAEIEDNTVSEILTPFFFARGNLFITLYNGSEYF